MPRTAGGRRGRHRTARIPAVYYRDRTVSGAVGASVGDGRGNARLGRRARHQGARSTTTHPRPPIPTRVTHAPGRKLAVHVISRRHGERSAVGRCLWVGVTAHACAACSCGWLWCGARVNVRCKRWREGYIYVLSCHLFKSSCVIILCAFFSRVIFSGFYYRMNLCTLSSTIFSRAIFSRGIFLRFSVFYVPFFFTRCSCSAFLTCPLLTCTLSTISFFHALYLSYSVLICNLFTCSLFMCIFNVLSLIGLYCTCLIFTDFVFFFKYCLFTR